jgi:uncharacterized protein YecE (DUF72 family)
VALLAGTSGYAYKEWKGSFYPDDLPAKGMLGYYAGRLPAVEINNTFYRIPKASVVESWAAQLPPHFRFVLKASRRITHFKHEDAGAGPALATQRLSLDESTRIARVRPARSTRKAG